MSDGTCACSDDRILAYVTGELAERDAAALAEHLGACPECRERAAEFWALDAVLPGCCDEGVVRWHSFRTPFGTMYVAATERGLARVSWGRSSPHDFVREMERRFPGRPVVRDPGALAEAERQLREYFAGARSRFDLPVDLTALSEFERRVLEAARRISYGEVVAYSDLARKLGKPRASRAVGNALAHNPVAIVVPCHRVVRRDGSLGGYGGGIECKKRLLAIEGREDLVRSA